MDLVDPVFNPNCLQRLSDSSDTEEGIIVRQLIDYMTTSPASGIGDADPAESLLMQLEAGDHHSAGPSVVDVDSPDMTSDIDGGSSYSKLVKKELQLTIQLRRLQRGQDEYVMPKSASSSTSVEIQQVSQETLEMQRRRKERNRTSARICRMQRRVKEKKLKEQLLQLQEEIIRLNQKAKKFEQLYRGSLKSFPTKSDFQSYLQANQQLVRDPDVKPVLKEFYTHDYPKLPNFVLMALVPADRVS